MAFDAQRVTLIGNLTDDPVLRGEGDARRATFRVAANSGTGENKKSAFYNVTAFNGRYDSLADNVIASLRRGMRVFVDGVLEQYQIQASVNGETKDITITSVRAYAVGPELTRASADVTKNPRDDQQAAAPQYQQAPQGQAAQQPVQQAQQAPVATAPSGGDVF